MDNRKAINILTRLEESLNDYCGLNEECRTAFKTAFAALKQPERKTAYWVRVHGFCTPGGDEVWQCSECGKGRHVYGIEHGTYGKDVSDGQWVSCPNCDARMLGEKYE